MPFRTTFECLWCGDPWTVRGPEDLEGFALLCPTCIGRAGENGFLRFRLKTALAERAAARALAPAGSTSSDGVASPAPVGSEPEETSPFDAVAAETIAYYAAGAAEHDDWYLRRGRHELGPVHDQAWAAELDTATLWLDRLPWSGEIVELAAGTGWWSPLLASKGELSIYDATDAPLDLARDRLVAHRLRAHIHVRDAWAEPDRAVDGLFVGFWLSHIPRPRLAEWLLLARRWLKPGGTFAFIDARTDPQSGAPDLTIETEPERAAGIVRRRLDDGREFRLIEIHRQPEELESALLAAGFASAVVASTPRFFVHGRAGA